MGADGPEAGEVRQIDEEEAADAEIKDVHVRERRAEELLLLICALTLGHASVVVPHEHNLGVGLQVGAQRLGLFVGRAGGLSQRSGQQQLCRNKMQWIEIHACVPCTSGFLGCSQRWLTARMSRAYWPSAAPLSVRYRVTSPSGCSRMSSCRDMLSVISPPSSLLASTKVKLIPSGTSPPSPPDEALTDVGLKAFWGLV